jgi:hypothetical protein
LPKPAIKIKRPLGLYRTKFFALFPKSKILFARESNKAPLAGISIQHYTGQLFKTSKQKKKGLRKKKRMINFGAV